MMGQVYFGKIRAAILAALKCALLVTIYDVVHTNTNTLHPS